MQPIGVLRAELEGGVFAGADPDEHARRRALQAVRGLRRVLERLPGHLEQQALLGIHARDFTGRDTEETRVEPLDALQEAAPPCVHLPGSIGVRVEEGVDVPALARHLGDGIHTVTQESPVRFGIDGSPGEPAAQTDDRDGLVRDQVPPLCARLDSQSRAGIDGQRPGQVVGHGLDRREVEGEGARQRASKARLQAVPELDGHQ